MEIPTSITLAHMSGVGQTIGQHWGLIQVISYTKNWLHEANYNVFCEVPCSGNTRITKYDLTIYHWTQIVYQLIKQTNLSREDVCLACRLKETTFSVILAVSHSPSLMLTKDMPQFYIIWHRICGRKLIIHQVRDNNARDLIHIWYENE